MFSKKILLSALIGGFGLLTVQSCKPYAFVEESLGSFAVINAIPGEAIHITLDGLLHTPTVIASGGVSSTSSSIYLPVIGGSKVVGVSRDTGKTNVVTNTYNFERGSMATIVAVGVPPQRKLVSLRDDITLAPDDRAKVRFIHTAPTTGPVDVTFARGTTDSVTLTNRDFIGNATNVTPQETFITVPLTANRTPPQTPPTAPNNTTAYTIRVKAAGTGNVISSVTVNFGGNYSSPQNRVLTAILRGGAVSVPLSTTVIRNY